MASVRAVIQRFLGKRPASPRAARSPYRRVIARYDAATTTDDNKRHWANADGLSADAAANPEVRQALRNRCRYEAANNSYAKGIVLTLANDVVGTGPRLQLLLDDRIAAKQVEQAFASWALAVNLPEKLRTMRMSRATDGEVYAVLKTNPLVNHPVKLDPQLIEADRVTTPTLDTLNDQTVDGIEFDSHGNAIAYHILRNHPGDALLLGGSGVEFDRLLAADVIHYFRRDRPGQSRGIPDIMPALPLFAQLRRYTLAVIAAAETAADFAAVIESAAPPDPDEDQPESMDLIELEKRMATILPQGYKLGQIDAKQPTTTYPEFKREILNEIARCLNMPLNVALGNSSGYNYASGRLDHQTYFKSIHIEQVDLGCTVVDRILAAWLREAVLITGLLPLSIRQIAARDELPPRQWFWDGTEHVDPKKDADAQATRLLASGTTNLAIELARSGLDWEEVMRQRAKELELAATLGLVAVPAGEPAAANDEDDDDEE